MTVTEQLQGIINAKETLREAINDKGGDLSEDAKLSEFAEAVDGLSGGGGKKFKPLALVDVFFNYTGTNADLSMVDASEVNSMSRMIYGCPNLDKLNLNGVVATNKLTNMYCAFYHCPKIKSLDLSGWDVSNVTNMSWMFTSDYGLEILNWDGWDFGKVTTFSSWFLSYSSSGTFALREIRGTFTNLGKASNQVQDFSLLLNLDNASVQRIINALYPKAGTIKFHADVKANMTDQQKTEIANKGWTLQ